LWTTHPALRDIGVGPILRPCSDIGVAARSYPNSQLALDRDEDDLRGMMLAPGFDKRDERPGFAGRSTPGRYADKK